MKTLILALLISTAAQASNTANYFRFWQGFKKHQLTQEEFLTGLNPFMKLTVDTYGGKGLENYVVAVPPAGKPAFVPDEFALVAFDSKESYDKVRATPEGKAYGAAHWEIFDKNLSKSAEMRMLTADVKEIDWNVAYNVLGKGIPLTNTYVTFFVGARKEGVDVDTYRSRMLEHFRFVARTFEPKGLVGYLALAQRNYEVAYVIWDSKESADKAFASDEGKAVLADTETILTPLMFMEAQIFDGEVAQQSVYKALE
jgi:hypothetical protein